MKSFARELKNVLVGSPVLLRRLQIEPGENLSEKLRAMGFSDAQLQSRASNLLPGAGEAPPGVLKHTLLERSALALEPVEERPPTPKPEVKKTSRRPYLVVLLVLACLVVAGVLLFK
jgi:hypothetical protein